MNAVLIGNVKDRPNVKVGDKIYCSAAAPGCGHVVYRVIGIDNRGNIYAKVIENTVRIMDPSEVI